MGRVSLSKSALVLSPCLRWAWEGAKEYEDEFADTTKRDAGTEFHGAIDAYYTGSAYAAWKFPGTAHLLGVAVNWSHKELEPRCTQIDSEVYVGYNFSTGKHHVDAAVHSRQYPKKPGYTPGTADLVCILATGELLVADWKTGGGTGAPQQLASLALGLQQEYLSDTGAKRPVRLAILYINEHGVFPEEWAISDAELEAHRTAMQFQLMDIGKRKDPQPGIHCTQLYCNHLAYCPGITGPVQETALVDASSLVRTRAQQWPLTEAPSCDEHAGSIMERITASKRQLKFLEARVQKYLESGGKAIAGDFEYSRKADGHRWRSRK